MIPYNQRFPKFKIDQELDLLTPPGEQGLFSEDPSKNFYNDNNMLRADGGQWLNAGGQRDCKNKCKTLFPAIKELPLFAHCQNTCASKCGIRKCHGYNPTRSSICIDKGLNADCTPKADAVKDLNGRPITPPTNNAGSRSESTSNTSSKSTAKILIIGVSALTVATVVGIIIYRKVKK